MRLQSDIIKVNKVPGNPRFLLDKKRVVTGTL